MRCARSPHHRGLAIGPRPCRRWAQCRASSGGECPQMGQPHAQSRDGARPRPARLPQGGIVADAAQHRASGLRLPSELGGRLAAALLSAAIIYTGAAGAGAAQELQQQQASASSLEVEATCQAPPSASTASKQRLGPSPSIGNLAALFGGDAEDKDPIEPFTMYGTTSKKFVIEQLDGEKIVARRRGFTVRACISAIPQSQETPEFQGLPTGEKVFAAGERTCSQAEGADMKPACISSCGTACEAAFEAYAAEYKQRMGYVLDEKDRVRLLKNCKRSCAYECTKGGKAYDFVVPYRR